MPNRAEEFDKLIKFIQTSFLFKYRRYSVRVGMHAETHADLLCSKGYNGALSLGTDVQ